MYSHHFHFCWQSRTDLGHSGPGISCLLLTRACTRPRRKQTSTVHIEAHCFVTLVGFPFKRGTQYLLLQNWLCLIPISITKLWVAFFLMWDGLKAFICTMQAVKYCSWREERMQRICTKLWFSLIAGTGFVQRVLLLGDKLRKLQRWGRRPEEDREI